MTDEQMARPMRKVRTGPARRPTRVAPKVPYERLRRSGAGLLGVGRSEP